MPKTTIFFYCEEDGTSPVLDWLEKLRRDNARAHANCLEYLERLGIFGHELRRPYADYLDDGIYELRIRGGRVHYRLLYFFRGKNIAVVAHGIMKQGKVPRIDLDRAKKRKTKFAANPTLHSHPR